SSFPLLCSFFLPTLRPLHFTLFPYTTLFRSSGPAIERIEKSPIKEMVITDSINLPEDKKIDKVVQVSVGPLIGDAIKRIHEHKRSEEHTSELQSRFDLVCRLLLEKKKKNNT